MIQKKTSRVYKRRPVSHQYRFLCSFLLMGSGNVSNCGKFVRTQKQWKQLSLLYKWFFPTHLKGCKLFMIPNPIRKSFFFWYFSSQTLPSQSHSVVLTCTSHFLPVFGGLPLQLQKHCWVHRWHWGAFPEFMTYKCYTISFCWPFLLALYSFVENIMAIMINKIINGYNYKLWHIVIKYYYHFHSCCWKLLAVFLF